MRVFPKENPIFLDRRRKRISTHISGVRIGTIKYNVDRAENCADEIDDMLMEQVIAPAAT